MFKIIVTALMAAALPLSAASAGGTFLGTDPEGDKKAAVDQAFGEHSAADKNADATITKDEWMEYQAENQSAPAFQDLDANRDGKITTDEWEAHSGGSGSVGTGDGTAGQQ